jgi:hypothetical protein
VVVPEAVVVGPQEKEGRAVRTIVVTAVLLAVLAGASAAEIDGAFVNIISPTAVVPGQTYMFRFWVQNASSDNEAIASVKISFPDGYTLHEPTMYCVPLVADPLRPSWDMSIPPIDHTGIWVDNNGGTGELYANEGTEVGIEVQVASQLYDIPIYWCLDGDGSGEGPHRICGCIDLATSPVADASWSSIKALYR